MTDAFSTFMSQPRHPPSAVAFGNFDGVHVGHRALLAEIGRISAERAYQTTAVTFDPHPLELVNPERAPRSLDTLQWRRWWLQAVGADHVEVLKFDEQLRARSAEWFAEEILFGVLNSKLLVVSDESRFGHRGRGDISLLREMAPRFGAEVLRCEAVLHGGRAVSSSRLRRLVEAGEIGLVNEMLERRFALRGVVIHGDARGREIGFPTANLEIGKQVQPATGVYAGWLVRQEPGEPERWRCPAVCNIGVRPTVGGERWQVEAHAIDWSGDLYGQRLSLELERRIRGERKFESFELLARQIERDREQARDILTGHR